VGRAREVTSRGTILVLLIEALQNTSPGGDGMESGVVSTIPACNASSSQVLVALAREWGR